MKKSELSPKLLKLVNKRIEESKERTIGRALPEGYWQDKFYWQNTKEGFEFWNTLDDCISMPQFTMTKEYKIWLTNNSKEIQKDLVTILSVLFYVIIFIVGAYILIKNYEQ